jgi:hypothetical protein
MNKHFEYMTLGIPFVQFDLTEALRSTLARKGVARARTLLDWARESGQLIAAYEKALGRKAPAEPLESVLVDVAAAA